MSEAGFSLLVTGCSLLVKLGAQRTFAKPVERDELLKAVRELLG